MGNQSKVKVTEAQRRGLEFLATPWCASWWGGKPHAGWPKELNARTFDALRERGFVKVERIVGFDRTFALTDSGRSLIKDGETK